MALGLENSNQGLVHVNGKLLYQKKKLQREILICLYRDNILREHVDFIITYLEMRE